MGVTKESTKIPELETEILESYASKYEGIEKPLV